MVQTRSRYYRSPSPDYLEDIHTTNLDPDVDTNEFFEPISALDTTSTPRIWSVGMFDKMEDDHHGSVRDWFSGRTGAFPCPIGNSSFVPRLRRNVKGLPISMIGMPLNFCLSIWNMRHSKLMNARQRVSSDNFERWSNIVRLELSLFEPLKMGRLPPKLHPP